MVAKAVVNRTGAGQTTLSSGKSTRAATIVVDPSDVIDEVSNVGTVVEQTLGDGRKVTPVQLSTPPDLYPGQYWVQHDAGVTYFVFVDQFGTEQRLSATAAGVIPTPTAISISGSPTINTLITANVDTVGIGYWSIAFTKITTGERFAALVVMGHNGTDIDDATVVDFSLESDGVSIGTFDINLTADLSGSGASQVMRLRAEGMSVGWTAYVVPERLTAP